jgi:hypothetical protein
MAKTEDVSDGARNNRIIFKDVLKHQRLVCASYYLQ